MNKSLQDALQSTLLKQSYEDYKIENRSQTTVFSPDS